MPLLPKYFGKRDKSSNNLEVPDTNPPRSSSFPSSKLSENVLPGRNSLPDTNQGDPGHRMLSPSKEDDIYSNTKGSSSSSRLKMTMSSFKRKATVPDKFSTSPRSSLSVRDSLEPPPSRTSVFMAFGRSSSSQSLPNDQSKSPYGVPQLPVIDLPDPSFFKRPSPITSQTTLPVPKTPEMRTSNTVKIFNRGSKPTRMSEAPQLDLQIPSSSNQVPDSFSLKSFRPVRPASPSPSNTLDLQPPPFFSDQPRSQSPASLLPPSPVGDPRPRGSSMGSDTSQKITVAQFRQAQLESAKNRSSVHLPVPEHPSDSMPPGNIPLHMSLARPASPSFALAAGNSAGTGGNESAGENGAPSRPGRLLPPQAIGRSSPIPREQTPISSSPVLRPRSTNRPQDGARLSAKWMLTSDSDSEASEDTASDDATRRTSKKPPLIGDFRKLNGTKSPKPDTSTSPYPSSFASPPINRIAMSGSKSDLGHSSSSTARHTAKPSSLATTTHIRSSSSFTPSTFSIQNIKPGQYSGGGASPPSPSVMTHITGESVDAWSATHSAVHSHQGSSDQLFRQGQRAIAKSDLGHGGHIKRSAGVSVRRTGAVDDSLSTPSKLVASRSQSTNVSTQPSSSSFNAPKAGRRTTSPAMLESDTEEEGQPSSTEDDAPLSALLPPRRPGSGLSSQGSGSPRTSTITVPVRDQSPTRSTRSTATRLSRSSLGGLGSAPTSRSMTSPDSRKVSTNSTSPVSKEQVSEPKSPLSRGRKPLIDLSSSAPTVTTQPPRSTAVTPPPAISGNESNQASLLTPPISERGFNSSPAEAARKQSPSASPSSFWRPGPSAIQRSHGHLTRPFTRDDSPSSSVGNSSIGSGIFPNTPGTGSDAGRSIGNSQSVITTSSGSSGNDAPRIGGGKQPSITFDESVIFTQKKTLHRRGISGSSSGSTSGLNPYDEQEAKRNERRRNEAKASVELGRVVNGPAPIDPDDDEEDNTAVLPITQNQPPNWNPWQNMSQHQQVHAMGVNVGPTAPGMSPLQMNMGMNANMGNPIFNPLMSQVNMGGLMPPQQMYNPMMQAGMGMPMGFNLPPVPTMSNMMMGMDPSMMAAHQQAMAMAKHAYQMAVAQQAIAAAGDEWERSSNMGYGSAPRAPTMYGTPAGSIYGGGSLLGVGAPAGGSIWGGSVYGDAFGPAQHQHDRRQIPAMGGHYGSSLEAEDVNSRTQGRKRTVTSPSSALPPAHLRGAGAPPMPPPSSWRPS